MRRLPCAKELDNFGKVLTAPEKYVLAILDGAKVSDKILLIKNMCSKVDQIIWNGPMGVFEMAKFEAGTAL